MMEVRLTDDYLNLGGKEYVLSEVTDSLANLSALQLVTFLNGLNIKLPRVINSAALRGALNSKVVEAKSLNLSDEMMYRLRFYPDFSEYQLQSFYKMVYQPEMDIKYKKSLFTLILMNATLLGVTDEHVLQMLELAPEPYEEFSKFEDVLMPALYDFNKDFDGVRKETLVVSLRKSATALDIRDLGQKYGISIPKRLKRDEMQALIEEGLRKQHKLTEEMKAKLDKLPIINLQRVAKQNGIKVSVDLKKEDLIAYLLNEVDKAKFETRPRLKYELDLADGFVFDLAYVMEVEEIEEFINEQNEEDGVVVEPVVEPVKEEVVQPVEEVKEPEPVQEEVIVEEHVEEPVVEEVKEEVKEEVIEEEPVKEEPQEDVVKEEPKEVAKEVVKESCFDYEKLTKCVIDVIRELTPILTRPKEPTPAPVVNIYNYEPKPESKPEPVEEKKPLVLKRYGYHNFDSQISPIYDAKVATTMALADVSEYVDQPIKVEPPHVEAAPVVEEVKPEEPAKEEPKEEAVVAPEVTVVEKPMKAKRPRLTNKQRIANMKAARARKLNKGLVEEPAAKEEAPVSNEAVSPAPAFVIPAQIIPGGNQAADTIPANIVVMTDGGQTEAVPTGYGQAPTKQLSPKETKRLEKENAKTVKKLQKKQDKIDHQEHAKNVAKMRKSLDQGVSYNMDDKFFDQTMRIKEYKLKVRQDMRERRKATGNVVGAIFKTIIIIAVILLVAYLVIAGLLTFNVIKGWDDPANNMNSFYNALFKGFVDWLKSLMQK